MVKDNKTTNIYNLNDLEAVLPTNKAIQAVTKLKPCWKDILDDIVETIVKEVWVLINLTIENEEVELSLVKYSEGIEEELYFEYHNITTHEVGNDYDSLVTLLQSNNILEYELEIKELILDKINSL